MPRALPVLNKIWGDSKMIAINRIVHDLTRLTAALDMPIKGRCIRPSKIQGPRLEKGPKALAKARAKQPNC